MESANDTYSRIFKEILDLPELAKSREVLEGQSILEIVKHGLERQYTMGAIEALSEELMYKDDEDDEKGS